MKYIGKIGNLSNFRRNTQKKHIYFLERKKSSFWPFLFFFEQLENSSFNILKVPLRYENGYTLQDGRLLREIKIKLPLWSVHDMNEMRRVFNIMDANNNNKRQRENSLRDQNNESISLLPQDVIQKYFTILI